jgi:hypothetical protein
LAREKRRRPYVLNASAAGEVVSQRFGRSRPSRWPLKVSVRFGSIDFLRKSAFLADRLKERMLLSGA